MSDTSSMGEVSRWQIIAALTRRRKHLLTPIGDHLRYDLVIDDEGTFLRVQCKTGRLRNGAVWFPACSRCSRKGPNGYVRRTYRGEIELFGVYCPDNGKCYLVPVGEVASISGCLRTDPPGNGQKTRIHWAEDYEM
jgi:hypothetical protein